MLRACRRLLKPGGRLAFYTIFVASGLSERDYRRALSRGASCISTRRLEYAQLISSAGLTLLAKHDVTREFLETARGWHRARAKYEDQLRKIEGDATFEQRQQDAIAQIAAVEDELIQRALFIATVRLM